MSKIPVLADFKIKITSEDPDTVANAIDQISRLYEHSSHSSVIQSTPRSWHGFITVSKGSPTLASFMPRGRE